MVKKIQGADGKVYKQVIPPNGNGDRKRTLEIVFGIISFGRSLCSLVWVADLFVEAVHTQLDGFKLIA